LFPPFLERLGDKLLHVAEYGVLAVLWYRAFRHAWYRASALTALSLAIVAATVYGVSDEVHQAFVPSRTSDPWDVAADLAGACVGSSLWFLGESRRSRPIKAHQRKDRMV
jgi:VanZ family protein